MDATRAIRDSPRWRGGRAVSAVRLQKVASIQRAVVRAREELAAAGVEFARDRTRQDAAVLNILRACETALDLANMMIGERRLGVPQSSRDSFRLLAEAGLIDDDLGQRLQRMVGFRNIAVHQYQMLDIAIVESILRRDLDDVLRYAEIIARLP
jgi:uncharacterized protein YutE (UPF0331/DUF86 family)